MARLARKDARLSPGVVAIAESASARRLLIDADRVLVHESGFFRIGPEPLPAELVARLSAEVRILVLNYVKENQESIFAQVRSLIAGESYLSNRFGYMFVYEFFQNMICCDAPDEIRSAIDTYVRDSILKEDVLGNFDSQDRARRSFNERMATYAVERGGIEESRDLLDVAIKASDKPREQAEIFHRLILSTVGFTGCALEWALVGLSRQSKFLDSEEFVLEVLRFYSPIWRLTRRVNHDFALKDFRVQQGDRVFVNLFQINRSAEMGDCPNKFDPGRMRNRDARGSLLSFGKGRRSCPAQKPALLFLTLVVSEMRQNFQVSFNRKGFSHPRFATFIACTKGSFVLRPR